jgi:hypothetical protein
MEIIKGQKYIIRCDRAGVFYAEIAELNGDVADLVNARRVHGWEGACSISQLAVDGPQKSGGNNRWSVTVPSMTVFGVTEISLVTDEAQAVIDKVPVWKI